MHYRAVARAIFKAASSEEALINGFRVYPVLYDMPFEGLQKRNDESQPMGKKLRSGDNVSVLLTFSTSKNFAIIHSYMYIVEETSRCSRQKRTRNRLVRP